MRHLAFVLLAACGGSSSGTTALFALPGDVPDDFYATPFPNDLRREADGTIDLSAFPTNSLIADSYRQAADALDGFGLNAAVYSRFDGEIDASTLPDPAASTTEAASVYLVNVDPNSPDYGMRTPAAIKFRVEKTQTLGENHLIVRPYPGFGLAELTTYAMVITDRTGAKRSSTFEALMGSGGDAKIVAAREVYAKFFGWLDQPGDDDREDVISAAVFTTQRATHIVPALRKGVFAAPLPVATNIQADAPSGTFTIFTGAYMQPNFQSGTVPYKNSPDGKIMINGDTAVVQRMEPMRFGMSVPTGAVPPNGFPIAIYSHGTGGDHLSFYGDGTAAALAAEGVAMISTDQVLHGPRNPGGDETIDFFNIANPQAMQANSLQGTADAFAQLRLVQTMQFQDGGRTIKFDQTKVYFFGHSQGGLTGPGFVAFEPSLTGAVLSGTGGVAYLGLLYKTKPVDVSALLQVLVRDEPWDDDNPSMAMAQMWLEPMDAANYAPMFVRRPVGLPRNIFQTEGFTDSYTPNQSIEALAVAIGGDIVQNPDAKEIVGVTLRSRSMKSAPISGNVGGVTAALAQFKQRPGSDGHFVVFDIPTATRQAAGFLGTLARTGTATVVE